MKRALESARMLEAALNMPVVIDNAFREWTCDDGTLTPQAFSALWQQVPETQKPFFRFMDGYETGFEFSGRVQAALNHVCEKYAEQTIVLVSHGEVIAAAFSYFFGLSAAIPSRVTLAAKFASLTHWFKAPGAQRWTLERYNDYHHLTI
jgi:probable phosphoglycerate mutase